MENGSPGEHAALTAQDALRIVALAEVATPAGRHVRAPDGALVAEIAAALPHLGPRFAKDYGKLLLALDLAAVPLTGRRFSELDVEARTRALHRLNEPTATHLLVRAATTPIKLAQVLRGLPAELGASVGVSSLRVVPEPQRWQQQMSDARTLADGETLEVDAVVVGSGAGGAPVALALASRGHAVVILEAGAYFGREDFVGHSWKRGMAMMQQNFTLGNTSILLPTGQTVGGTTTVNSGTCFRTPAEVLRRWRFEDGLDLDPASMDAYFQRVEAMLGVSHAEPSTLGGVGRVVARGAERLGWEHGPLPRNAPGCDAQGTCCFGCPTDAKRSTNVSYVPAALGAGAMLVHHARVEEVLVAGGRAVGVVARAVGGDGRRIRIHARSVVLSAGTLGTTALLAKQGLCGRSGELGRNLTIHPATHAWGLFDERIEGWRGIPQGYGVDSFLGEGLRMEGAFVPLDVAASSIPEVGEQWTRFVERFDRIANYGFMIAETSRGRVVLGPGGAPQVLYRLNDTDRRRILRGQSLLARLFLAAGAQVVYPGIRGLEPINTEVDALALEHASVSASRLELSAYHPLGTCRMGRDPARSVVNAQHEAHELPNLFVVDGSVVSGPLGVNPQITIMALAERAGALLADRLEHENERTAQAAAARAARQASQSAYKQQLEQARDDNNFAQTVDAAASRAHPELAARSSTALAARPGVEFAETMSGFCTRLSDGRKLDACFTVCASAPRAADIARLLLSPAGGTFALHGTTTIDELAHQRACAGTLRMRPLRTRGTLIYDLDFQGDDGLAYHLHGEKSVRLSSLLSGMTTLTTELARADDGLPFARGTLTFALTDLLPFLATWRIRTAAAS